MIGRNSHASLRSTTSAHFDFVPRQKKILRLELVTWHVYLHIFYTFESSFSLTLNSSQRATHCSRELNASETQPKNGRTYNQQKYIHCHNEIGIFATLQYSKLCKIISHKIISHIQIHMFSKQPDKYFVAMYFLVSQRTYTHKYIRTTHTFCIIVVLALPPHTNS